MKVDLGFRIYLILDIDISLIMPRFSNLEFPILKKDKKKDRFLS